MPEMINTVARELTNEEINSIVSTAESQVPKDVIDMRELKETVNVNPDAELETGEVLTSIDNHHNEIDLIAKEFEDAVDEDIYDPEITKDNIDNTAEKAKDDFNLTDDETYQLLDTLQKMQEDSKYPVYKNIPESMQNIVKELAKSGNIPANHYNEIARMMLSEMISDTGLQSAMIDLEKSLNEALSIPSISDLYSEHTREVMEVHIPETIEKIKDEYPEKARVLGLVKDAFKKSYDYSFAKEEYMNNSRLRKFVRRDATKLDMLNRAFNDFNAMNNKSKFKMNDVTELPIVLKKVLIDDHHSNPEYVINIINKIKAGEELSENDPKFIPYCDDGCWYGYLNTREATPESLNNIDSYFKVFYSDIVKFCMLIVKSCQNKDPKSVIDASYMYYTMRNILILKHSKEAKTNFAAELISNIIETILMITNEEAKFYANDQNNSRHSAKLSTKGSTKS